MPILIVMLIGWFNWLVYSAHHCGALQDWCSHYTVTWCVLFFVRKLEYNEYEYCETNTDIATFELIHVHICSRIDDNKSANCNCN